VHLQALWNSLPNDLHYPLSHTASTNLSHSTNHYLLALSIRISVSLQTQDSSLPPIIPALVLLAPLLSRFSGSLNLALFSFRITIIITVSLISHFIYRPIRPTIVQWCLRISLHQVFTLAWLALAGTLNSSLVFFIIISSLHM